MGMEEFGERASVGAKKETSLAIVLLSVLILSLAIFALNAISYFVYTTEFSFKHSNPTVQGLTTIVAYALAIALARYSEPRNRALLASIVLATGAIVVVLTVDLVSSIQLFSAELLLATATAFFSVLAISLMCNKIASAYFVLAFSFFFSL